MYELAGKNRDSTKTKKTNLKKITENTNFDSIEIGM